MTLTISPLAEQHLQAVWEIEKSVHSHPWAQSMINDIESRGACHHVLLEGESVAGYFYAQNIVGEVTLLNIAIAPDRQGKGLGRKLLDEFINFCQQKNADSIWLEVRQSNTRAVNLYESVGFNEVDRRSGYYPAENGREDAIIMSYLFF